MYIQNSHDMVVINYFLFQIANNLQTALDHIEQSWERYKETLSSADRSRLIQYVALFFRKNENCQNIRLTVSGSSPQARKKNPPFPDTKNVHKEMSNSNCYGQTEPDEKTQVAFFSFGLRKLIDKMTNLSSVFY